MNRFGDRFAISIFGESHSESIGVVLDGVPAGLSISPSDFTEELERRKPGAVGTSKRIESDIPKIISGLFNGYATGAPLTIVFENNDTQQNHYDRIKNHPRPSHADLTAKVKFGGYNDYRGGGHHSGRVTIALVAAGVIAKKILLAHDITITSSIKNIGTEYNSERFESYIKEIMERGDSVGGVIECRAEGVKIGYGEPFFNSIESLISHIIFSIPGVKAVEFGSGFEGVKQFGSQQNDIIISSDGKCSSNNSGGVNGGISNGNDIVFSVAVKPTSSIFREQQTLNLKSNKIESLTIEGRHDSCIALRAGVVIEAATAIAICNFIEIGSN